MPNRPGTTNEDYNAMLKLQKRNRQRGNKQRLQKDYNNWFDLAQDLYGDQRMAQELANANPNMLSFGRGMTIRTPGQRKDPYMSQSFIEGKNWGALPGAAQGFTAQQKAAGTVAAGEQPGFAQQRQPTAAFKNANPPGLMGMERLPLRTDDVYAVLYRSMLPGTADRTQAPGMDKNRLSTLGREQPTQFAPGRNRAQDARQGATFLRPSQTQRQMTGEALPESARITGPAQEYMQIPRDIRRMQASQRALMPAQPSQEPFNLVSRELEKTRQKASTPLRQSADFQAPAYQRSEEIVVQFMKEHPEIREGDFSNVDLDQIAVLMNYGYVDMFAGTSAATTGGTGTIQNRFYPGGGGRGRGWGGGGGGGTYTMPRYSSGYGNQYGNPLNIGLVKWRIG